MFAAYQFCCGVWIPGLAALARDDNLAPGGSINPL